MHFMNTYDIQEHWQRVSLEDTPNLAKAILTLRHLSMWADQNSDGWAFWPKPARAANRLMTLIEEKSNPRSWIDQYDPQDVAPAELKAALSPIKAFLTRQGVAHSEVIES